MAYIDSNEGWWHHACFAWLTTSPTNETMPPNLHACFAW